MAYLFFPSFSHLTGIAIFPPMKYFIPGLVGIALVSGVLAGILPALVMASIKILQVIKQGNNWSMRSGAQNVNAKRVMITIQFCATIILLGSALLAHRQFAYIQNKNLGLKPDQIIAISGIPDKATRQYSVFKNRLKEIPGVQAVTACMQTPSSEIRDVGPVLVQGVNEDMSEAPMMDVQVVDPDFIEMMDLDIVAGADFSEKVVLNEVPEFSEAFNMGDYLAEVPREYLINETAMKQLGWKEPQEAIGQQINWSIGSFQLAYGPIVGVVKDYHQESLKNKVDPLVMIVEPLWLSNILIKVETNGMEKALAGIESSWNGLFPYTLEYTFLDEMFNRLYHQDRAQLKLLSILALIAIFISFMGLVSLVAYALKRRSKELAIRRVIGADMGALTRLIGKEYFWVLAVAAVVGIPVSYKWVSDWLQQFAYHIDIFAIGIFLVSPSGVCLAPAYYLFADLAGLRLKIRLMHCGKSRGGVKHMGTLDT